MKYKIIILFFLTSCTSNTYLDKGSFTYSAKGFAKIESQSFSKLDDKFFVSHNKLSLGTKIILTNPTNEKSLEMIIRKKRKEPRTMTQLQGKPRRLHDGRIGRQASTSVLQIELAEKAQPNLHVTSGVFRKKPHISILKIKKIIGIRHHQ